MKGEGGSEELSLSLYIPDGSHCHIGQGVVMNLSPFLFNRARITIDVDLQNLMVATERRMQ